MGIIGELENKIRIISRFWEVLEGIISKILSILGSGLVGSTDKHAS